MAACRRGWWCWGHVFESSLDESMDGNLPRTRLLVPFYQREHLLEYSLPMIARSGNSRPLADVAMLLPGGLVDLT